MKRIPIGSDPASKGQTRPGFVAAGRSGYSDVAEHHEELLFQGESGARLPRPLPKGVGLYESSTGDVADRAEDLLHQAARDRRRD